MRERQTLTIEVVAAIDDVWAVLATADGWDLGDGDGSVVVVSSRAPDRVTWHVVGRVQGEVEWELDDLDELTFARSDWQVAPAHVRVPRGRRTEQRAHDARASAVGTRLSARLGVDLLAVRSDPRRPRGVPERAPRGAGPMLLGAMWLAGNPRRT